MSKQRQLKQANTPAVRPAAAPVPAPMPAGQATVSSKQVAVTASQFSGPIPPPEILRMYDEVVPGTAATIISWAQTEAGHVRDMERLAVEGELKERARGQWMGLTIGVVALVAAVVCVVLGSAWVGATIGGATVVSLVGAFVYGQYVQRQDRTNDPAGEDRSSGKK